VRLSVRPIVASLTVAALWLTGGCGGQGETSGPGAPPAAIGGPGAENVPSDADPSNNPSGSPRKGDYDPDHPTVVIETSLGDMTVRLDARNAPLTVANFLTYVRNGHYDGTIFHQVVKQYPKLIIGGAYTKDLTEKPTLTSVRNEAHNGLKNRRGTIAMARRPDWIDSATCHFFVNITDNEVLDHKDRTLEGYGYCVFGEVTDGMDVADRIASLEVHDTEQFEQIPIEPVVIRTIRVVR